MRLSTRTLAQQTVVAIARALSQADAEVALVILDEPTAALPIDERDEVLATVASLKARGIAILYVSHHLDEIAEIGDRVVVLRAGSVVHDVTGHRRTPAELLTMMSGELAVHTDGSPRAAAGEPLLSIRGLETDQLRGIDLALGAGEVLGLVGALDSGAGHVCRAIAGSIGYRGSIEVGGRRLRPGSIADSVRRGVFMVPSDRRGQGIIADLDVTENLQIASLRRQFPLAPVSRRRERTEVQRAMDLLDIRPRDPRRKVGMLSGGNQQKVVLARALAQQPRVMVLENPTQGVDPAARLQIRAAIRDAAAAGLSVVVSDVDEAEISAVADRVIRLDSGAVMDTATAG